MWRLLALTNIPYNEGGRPDWLLCLMFITVSMSLSVRTIGILSSICLRAEVQIKDG